MMPPNEIWMEFLRSIFTEFLLMRWRSSRSPDKSGIMEIPFSEEREMIRVKSSPLFEPARVLVRFNHVTRIIVNANHSIG
jgi:hypothetical protein